MVFCVIVVIFLMTHLLNTFKSMVVDDFNLDEIHANY